jgi:hypothetical protein
LTAVRRGFSLASTFHRDDEPFAFGCGAQAVVTADKFEGRRAAFGGHEGGSQLKGVGRAKIVVLGNPQAVGRAFRPA